MSFAKLSIRQPKETFKTMSECAFQSIEHLKSGLSLSSRSGCPLDCAYCLLHAGDSNGKRVSVLDAPDTLVARLMRPETLFLNGKTPLFLNNRTDPFLPEVVPDTFRMLHLLAKNAVRSQVVLVSIFFPPDERVEYCEKLSLMFIYSYSAIEDDFNFNDISRIREITRTFPAGHLFHYLRPIIPGRNDNMTSLRKVLLLFYDAGFSGSILSGIRVTRGNLAYLNGTAEEISAHKFFSPRVYQTLLEDPAISNRHYALFRHTSCAIDFFMKRANRLGYFLREGHCNPKCKNRENCEAAPCFSHPELRKCISDRFPNMKFALGTDGVAIQTPVSQEVTAFLKNAYGIRVTAEHLLLSPSEEVLSDASATNRL